MLASARSCRDYLRYVIWRMFALGCRCGHLFVQGDTVRVRLLNSLHESLERQAEMAVASDVTLQQSSACAANYGDLPVVALQ